MSSVRIKPPSSLRPHIYAPPTHTLIAPARVYALLSPLVHSVHSLRLPTFSSLMYIPSGNYTISVNTIERKCNFVIAFHRNFVYVYVYIYIYTCVHAE